MSARLGSNARHHRWLRARVHPGQGLLQQSAVWRQLPLPAATVKPVNFPTSIFSISQCLPRQCRCVEKPDPCDPSPCGPGTRCEVNRLGNSICHCLAGLIPKPDTITGCGPECESDYDCQQGYQCLNQKCVEKPDPCNPNPCGMMATCTPRYVFRVHRCNAVIFMSWPHHQSADCREGNATRENWVIVFTYMGAQKDPQVERVRRSILK